MKKCVKRHTVVQPQDKLYRFIPLTQNQNAVVDVSDFDWLSEWNWYAHWCPDTRTFYAGRNIELGNGKRATLRMNRAIVPCESTHEVDHKNHNTLDNRRENLRICTKSENSRNRTRHVINISGFKGVRLHKPGRWRAVIAVNGRKKHIGLFNSPVDAAKAYDAAAKQFHGEFALLNFS